MSCREPERVSERAAAQLVRDCIGDVEVCRYEDGSRPRMHDLNLIWPDGHVEAMEVTTATEATLRHVLHQISVQGHVAPLGMAHNWYVWLDEGTTDVRAVRGEIAGLLAQVERDGFTRLHRLHEDGARYSAAMAGLRRLGVAFGWRGGARAQPRIIVHPASRTSRHRPEAVNDEVERHAADNAVKLALSGRDQRHLFVLVDHPSVAPLVVWAALVDGLPPEAPPQLPEQVTVAWVASYRADGSPVVWQVHRGGRWAVLL